ncbi:MAG: SemiSWEET transporter [Bdellovibrionota bacterium]
MNSVLLIGSVAGFLTTISFAPQVIKILKTKNTEGISILMYACFVTGVVLWIIYGSLIKDIVLTCCNIVTFLLSSPVLYWLIKNKLQKK